MPYEIRKTGPESKPFCVFNKDTDENKGCSTTKPKAQAHMRALYAASAGEEMGKKEHIEGAAKQKELGEQLYDLVAKEGLEGGLQEQLEAVRTAFYELMRPKGPLGYAESPSEMSFVDADGEVLLCRCWKTGNYYKASYTTDEDGVVTIEPSEKWIEGEMQFTPTKKKAVEPVELVEKEEGSKSLPEMVKELWRKIVGGEASPNDFFTKQQTDGRYRWTSISSTAFKDSDDEIVATEAIDKSLERAPKVGYGPLLFWHEKGVQLGSCDFQRRSGLCLVESGLWDETNVAKAARTSIEADAKPWGISIKFLAFKGAPSLVNNTVVRTIWKDIQIVERSVLPKQKAATLFSAIQTEGGSVMLGEHIKELTKLLGDEKLVAAVVAQVDAVNKQGEKPTAVFKEITDPQAQLLAVATSLKEANPEAAQQIEASVAALKAPEAPSEEPPIKTEPAPVVIKDDAPKTLEEAVALLKAIGAQMVGVQKEVEALKASDAPRIIQIGGPPAAAPAATPVVEKTTYEAPKVVQEIASRILGVVA